jgi:hypothetical protein
VNTAMKWYQYSFPQPCHQKFDTLIELMSTEGGIGPKVHIIVLISKAPEIRITVEKSAEAYQYVRSTEKSPQPSWFWLAADTAGL